MKRKSLYLKPNVLLEPLLNKWCASSYLISPASSAMYVANWHIKVMQSFVAAPKIHMSALKNPKMQGGLFINYDQSRVNEIKDLLEKTTKEQAHILELAKAIKTLDNILVKEATGYSLEPLYEQVPEILQGYVELVYDMNNHPSVRFIEGLLYNSRYYQPSSQSIALSLIDTDKRSFIFSTPRLPEDNSLHLNLPFSHPGLDELFQMKNTPNDFGSIKEILGVEDKDDKLFASFITEDIPPLPPVYNGDNVRIRYFGHACILIETKEISILCDPLISYQYDNNIARYSYADLPESIDYILITHQHHDHCHFETLLQLRHKTKNIIVPRSHGGVLADPSLKLVLQNIGFERVIEIDELETLRTGSANIIGLPFFGEHGDLNIKTKMSYLVSLQEKSILIAADSKTLEPKLYNRIHDVVGDIDILFIGVQCDGAPLTWAYGSLLTQPLPRNMDQSRQVDGTNYEGAVEIVKRLHPQTVYVYAMGYEPWLSYLMSVQSTEDSRPSKEAKKLIEDCMSRGITAEKLFGHKEIFL